MRLALCLVVGGVILGCAAGLAASPAEDEARLLAPRCTDYQVKHRLISLGVAAVPALFQQLATPNKVLAFETRSILRWVTLRATPEEREALRDTLAQGLRAEQPAVRDFSAELLGIIGGDAIVPLLAPLLADEAVCATAANSINRVPGPAGTQALVGALKGGAPVAQVAVAQALGRRGDRAAVKPLIVLAKSEDDPVRAAAWGALAAIGDAEGEEAIRAGAARGRRESREAALMAMARLARAHREHKRAAEAKALCLEVIAHSRVPTTIAEALDGLGRLGDPRVVPEITGLLGHEFLTVQAAAVQALGRIPGPAATKALIEALGQTSPQTRYQVVEALATRADETAVPILVETAGSKDEGLAAAAVGALGGLPTAAATAAVSQLLASKSPVLQGAALDAALRQADALAARGLAKEAISLDTQVLDAAKDDGHRATALQGLGRVGGAESLAKVEALLGAEGRVGTEAALAYIALAGRLAGSDKDQAIKVYQKALDVLPVGPEMEAVLAHLRALGVSISSPQGFTTDWWVIGPFTEGDEAKGTAHPFAEQPLDLKKEYQIGGRALKWKPVSTPSDGHVDFLPLFQPNENVSAYAYAQVTVDKDQDVYLKVGSDDGVAIWVNGQKVHEKIVPRGLKVDEDRVDAHLKAGPNTLLCHVQNGGGGFDLCVRITDVRNRPVRFKMASQ
jgi:HEAT repeat protein